VPTALRDSGRLECISSAANFRFHFFDCRIWIYEIPNVASVTLARGAARSDCDQSHSVTSLN
jgi:hypothetical protein